MAGLEDMIRSATPGGNIAKPLLLGLVALLASGALFGKGDAGEVDPGFWTSGLGGADAVPF